MLIQDNRQSRPIKNNNFNGIKNFKLPISTFNTQSRNYNNNLKNEESQKAIKPQKEYSLIDDTYKILTDKIQVKKEIK